MKHMTASTARNDFSTVLDTVTRYNEPVTIVSDTNQVAVLMSIDDWNSIQETLFLSAIPGMVDAIKAADAESLDDGTEASEVDWSV